MRKFSDKTERTIRILIEPNDMYRLLYEYLRANGYSFEEKEIEFKYDWVEEGSQAYKTGKIQCHVKITKDLTENA